MSNSDQPTDRRKRRQLMKTLRELEKGGDLQSDENWQTFLGVCRDFENPGLLNERSALALFATWKSNPTPGVIDAGADFVRHAVHTLPHKSQARVIAKAFDDAPTSMQDKMIYMVNDHSDPAYLRFLVGVMQHSNPRLRSAAIAAIGHKDFDQSNSRVMNAISEAMHDPDPTVAENAQWEYAWITAPRVDLDPTDIPDWLHNLMNVASMWGHDDIESAREFASKTPGAAKAAGYYYEYFPDKEKLDRWLDRKKPKKTKAFKAFHTMREIARDVE